MQYPQTHSAFSDWGKFPLESNHFFLYLQADSNFPPSIHECITAEALKTISHIPFNRKHSSLFLPFKTPTAQTDDLFSGECRKNTLFLLSKKHSLHLMNLCEEFYGQVKHPLFGSIFLAYGIRGMDKSVY